MKPVGFSAKESLLAPPAPTSPSGLLASKAKRPGTDHLKGVRDEVDVIVESDRAPFVLADPPSTPIDRAIAANALPFIESGATLQVGIGGVPGAIVDPQIDQVR